MHTLYSGSWRIHLHPRVHSISKVVGMLVQIQLAGPGARGSMFVTSLFLAVHSGMWRQH